jgi:hypothetical protein
MSAPIVKSVITPRVEISGQQGVAFIHTPENSFGLPQINIVPTISMSEEEYSLVEKTFCTGIALYREGKLTTLLLSSFIPQEIYKDMSRDRLIADTSLEFELGGMVTYIKLIKKYQIEIAKFLAGERRGENWSLIHSKRRICAISHEPRERTRSQDNFCLIC